jgi:hypothetical protein
LVRLSNGGDIGNHRSQRIGEGFPLPRLMYRFNIHPAESSDEFEPHRIGIAVYKEQAIHNHLLASAVSLVRMPRKRFA